MTNRTRLLLITVMTTLAALIPVGLAVAGGGCHGGPSQGTGDTVEMRDACFTPSTLQIDPGATVTFVNRDPVEHNVSGMGWGNYESMRQGERISASFDQEGIYPYACTIHPGMTGAIVVGDGQGPANGVEVETPPLEGPAEAAVVTTSVGSGSDWLPAASIGLAAGVALGLGIASIRRRSDA